MWIIMKCDINRLRTEKGELRTPVRGDWKVQAKSLKTKKMLIFVELNYIKEETDIIELKNKVFKLIL